MSEPIIEGGIIEVITTFKKILYISSGNDVPYLCDYLLAQEDDATAIAKFLLNYADMGCVDLSYKDTLSYHKDSTYAAGASEYTRIIARTKY